MERADKSTLFAATILAKKTLTVWVISSHHIHLPPEGSSPEGGSGS